MATAAQTTVTVYCLMNSAHAPGGLKFHRSAENKAFDIGRIIWGTNPSNLCKALSMKQHREDSHG